MTLSRQGTCSGAVAALSLGARPDCQETDQGRVGRAHLGTPLATQAPFGTLWHHPRHVFDSWVWNFVWVSRGTLAGCRASRATAETSVLFYMSSVFRPIRRAQLEPWQRPLNFPISISLSSMLKVRMEHRSAMSRRPALSCPALLPPSLRTPDSFPRIQDSRT